MVYSNHNPTMPHQFESILRIQMGLGKNIFPTNKNGDHLVQVKYKLVGTKWTTIAGQHEQENNAFTPLICWLLQVLKSVSELTWSFSNFWSYFIMLSISTATMGMNWFGRFSSFAQEMDYCSGHHCHEAQAEQDDWFCHDTQVRSKMIK